MQVKANNSGKIVSPISLLGWRLKMGFIPLILLLLWQPMTVYAEETDSLQEAIGLFETEKYAEAKRIFQAIADQDDKNAAAAFYLGRICSYEDDAKLAIEWLKKAVELDEGNSEYHFWLGNAYGQKAQDASIFKAPGLAKKVKKEFEKAVEFDPDNVRARFALMQFYLQAPGIMGGSDKKAHRQAEEIKKRDPAWGHRAFGQIYEHEENYQLAEKEYLASVEENPQNLDSRYALSYFYQETGNFEKAFGTLEKLLEAHPGEINALYQIGRTGALSGQNWERAAECLQRYLQSEPAEGSPSIEWAHYRLGMVYHKAGKEDLAREQYEAALQLSPKFKEAKKALKQLN